MSQTIDHAEGVAAIAATLNDALDTGKGMDVQAFASACKAVGADPDKVRKLAIEAGLLVDGKKLTLGPVGVALVTSAYITG